LAKLQREPHLSAEALAKEEAAPRNSPASKRGIEPRDKLLVLEDQPFFEDERS
jgi:hypothetical protein